MALFDTYLERSRAIQQQFRRDKAATLGDKTLSDVGKRQRLEAIEAQRQGQVAQLQQEAQSWFTTTRGTLESRFKREAQEALDARIKLFGPQVVVDMLRHTLETMDAAGIAAAYNEAATDFERQAIGIYGRTLLQMRARISPTAETLLALETLNQAEPKSLQAARQEMREIDDASKRLDELDRETYNNELADRLGIDARYIDAE